MVGCERHVIAWVKDPDIASSLSEAMNGMWFETRSGQGPRRDRMRWEACGVIMAFDRSDVGGRCKLIEGEGHGA